MLKTVSSITNAIGALNYKGTWNASTNTPALASGVGTKGDYYVVSVAGSTTLDGISNWGVGDLATFNGIVWQRVEGGADGNFVNLSVSSTSTLSGLTASTALALDASKNVVSVTNTGTGSNVLATTPTIDTPVINGAATGSGVATAATANTLVMRGTAGEITVAAGSFTTISATDNVTLTKSAGVSKVSLTATAGTAVYFDDTSANGEWYVGANTGAANFEIRNLDRASFDFKIANATGIVTMSAYGAGAATFSAAGVISSVSDETWKIKDGVPTNPDVMLQKLEPGYWFYNKEKASTFGQDRQLGFYAQNVHNAIGKEAAPTPETYIVKDEKGNETSASKPWGYYDRSVLAVVVMSLKNALSTIEDLKQRIATLENKLG